MAAGRNNTMITDEDQDDKDITWNSSYRGTEHLRILDNDNPQYEV